MKEMSNLQLRIISAIVLGAAVLLITWLGGLPFRILAALISGAMFYEWAVMSRGALANRVAGSLAMLPEILILVFMLALVGGLGANLLIGFIALAAIALIVSAKAGMTTQWDAGGFVYAALSGLAIAMLRDGDASGLVAILFLFAIVWTTDILAYFVGRAIGGPKLAPAISPGKTWSGAIGGTIGGILGGFLIAALVGTGATFFLIIAAALLSVVSQLGDLFESWVKRRHGVKDSGRLIPGHGGVMDRADGLVAAAFAMYLIGWALGSADHPSHVFFSI